MQPDVREVDINDPDQVAEFFANWVNRVDRVDAAKVAYRLTTIHRTLQQSFMSFVMEFISQLAHNYRCDLFDARNEQAGRVAVAAEKAIAEITHGATRLPTI
jgi:hypothetical protein